MVSPPGGRLHPRRAVEAAGTADAPVASVTARREHGSVSAGPRRRGNVSPASLTPTLKRSSTDASAGDQPHPPSVTSEGRPYDPHAHRLPQGALRGRSA